MQLRDGTQVSIRPIRPDDKERLRTAFRGLGPDSIHTRFFHAKKDLSDDELRRLTELDPAKEVALVVTVGAERIIAVGRYIVTGEAAEVAFTVEEDFQHQGLAGRLLRDLVQVARERGVRRFDAYVLPENAAMLGVFEHCGLPLKRKHEDGVLRLTLELG